MSREEEIFDLLYKSYPEARCELDYGDIFQLLVAVILSAQCTDKRVNVVTKELFKVAKTPQDFATMDAETLEKLIFSCGFYKNKAKNIILASQAIVGKYGGQVPSDFNELITLPGVGRKTANVVSSVGFGGDGIAVDTHVFRTSNRLGLAKGKTPYEVEKGLEKVIPQGKRALAHHLLIFHGRYTCASQRPKCDKCTLKQYCDYIKEEKAK